MQPRYLTKSRFKLGMECPSKLFYTSKKDKYYDSKLDDDFLKALAEGGFQVGELAKRYFPGGINIEDLDYETSLAKTNELLTQDEVVIYEAAFKFQNLFIRADIVVKTGNKIDLIEVKAKSFDSVEDSFLGKKGGIDSNWRPYLEDIAFQSYVIKNAWPKFQVNSYLMLADKSKVSSVEGLNQMFFLYKTNGRQHCMYKGPNSLSALGTKILTSISVDHIIDMLFADKAAPTLEEKIHLFARNYEIDQQILPAIGRHCGKCEFRIPDNMETELQSGFHHCWQINGISAKELLQPLAIDIWNLHFTKKDSLFERKKYFLKDVNRDDIESKSSKKENLDNPWLSTIDRQMLQIQAATDRNIGRHINVEELKLQLRSWTFPLHFIDFETTSVAIPFHSQMKPYEQIAFQFSHHSILENGTIEHKGEWINTNMGQFPNFEFIRALKKELEVDNGTIFRFAAHENTILNKIYVQLLHSTEPDKAELCNWIKTLTHSTNSSVEKWTGDRDMVDLHELVKKYYYDPLMGGSNSIKKVLPAILTTSDYLKEKYAKPVYGKDIVSKNFKNQAWITYDEKGMLINPYKLLPPIHLEVDNDQLDGYEKLMDEGSGIMDGGAAMIAYARMQFTEMTNEERDRIQKALLRYCELDTFAMVMIYEAWKDWCN